MVFLHGGPGGWTNKANTKFFNDKVYRVVLFDQRGAGKSLPRNETKDNTTQHLMADIEQLREHLSISKWHMVFGGSWGSTLGLAYTQAHPDRVGSLVVRGIFLGRASELANTLHPGVGTALHFPDKYEAFLSFLPENERQDPLTAYHKRIISSDPEMVTAAARAWNAWELSVGTVKPMSDEECQTQLDDHEWCLTHALMETHYFTHGCFLEDGQLMTPANLAKMKDIPGESNHSVIAISLLGGVS